MFWLILLASVFVAPSNDVVYNADYVIVHTRYLQDGSTFVFYTFHSWDPIAEKKLQIFSVHYKRLAIQETETGYETNWIGVDPLGLDMKVNRIKVRMKRMYYLKTYQNPNLKAGQVILEPEVS